MSQDLSALDISNVCSDSNDVISASSSTSSLKRRASDSFECLDPSARKKMKEDSGLTDEPTKMGYFESGSSLMEEIAQELQCGCCAELVYRPVLVMPCQHFFCGRYGLLLSLMSVYYLSQFADYLSITAAALFGYA